MPIEIGVLYDAYTVANITVTYANTVIYDPNLSIIIAGDTSPVSGGAGPNLAENSGDTVDSSIRIIVGVIAALVFALGGLIIVVVWRRSRAKMMEADRLRALNLLKSSQDSPAATKSPVPSQREVSASGRWKQARPQSAARLDEN